MAAHIHKEAWACTDGWTGYKGLVARYPQLTREKSEEKGKNFSQLHRNIMMFKAWLRGVHHSVRYLQSALTTSTDTK
ncbi:MAG: hypothetical protein JWQ14_2009 [Adhaeribacter sp.]|nr:hypothetical protein [Adhaeribacter sp.]